MDWWSALTVVLLRVGAGAYPDGVAELARLDGIRAIAYAQADPDLLDDVYTPTATARDTDASTIDAYADRGGRVVGAGLLIERAAVIERGRDRVRLDVVDRLAASRVVWTDGTATRLPDDRPTRREVTLVRTPDGWRIATVRVRHP